MTKESSSFSLGFLYGGISATLLTSLSFSLYQLRQQSLKAAFLDGEPSDPNSFISAGMYLLKWIVKYRTTLVKDLPVISTVEPNYLSKLIPSRAPTNRESWTAIFHDINNAILPGLTHWECSSKFFAYFKPHASYPAVLGEMLCAGRFV